MGEEKSTEEIIKDLREQSKRIRACLEELSKRSEKSANPFLFEEVMLSNALSQNEAVGRLLERTDALKSIGKCTYIMTAEVSIILTVIVSIALGFLKLPI